jgi:hypothetical protein
MERLPEVAKILCDREVIRLNRDNDGLRRLARVFAPPKLKPEMVDEEAINVSQHIHHRWGQFEEIAVNVIEAAANQDSEVSNKAIKMMAGELGLVYDAPLEVLGSHATRLVVLATTGYATLDGSVPPAADARFRVAMYLMAEFWMGFGESAALHHADQVSVNGMLRPDLPVGFGELAGDADLLE